MGQQKTAPSSSSSASAAVVHKTDGYVVDDQDTATVVSLTELRQRYVDGKVSKEEFAAALRAHQVNNNVTATAVKSDADNGESEPEVVEAFNVTALSEEEEDDDNDDDDDDDDPSSKMMDIDGQSTVDLEISSPARKKKKKKKKVSASYVVIFAC